jgi:hypothetical protein
MIENYDFILKIIISMIPFLIAVLLYFRTGSLHMIFHRIWRLFFGSQLEKDDIVEKYNDERIKISKFRFMHNLPVNRHSDIIKVIDWIQKHDIPPNDAPHLKQWIQINNEITLIKPSTKHISSYLFILLFLFLTLFLANIFIMTNDMLIKVIRSDNFYLINYQNYSNVTKDKIINFSQCDKNLTNNLKTMDFDVLCNLSKLPDFKTMIQKNIKLQKYFGFIILIFSFSFIIWCYLKIHSYNLTTKYFKIINT